MTLILDDESNIHTIPLEGGIPIPEGMSNLKKGLLIAIPIGIGLTTAYIISTDKKKKKNKNK